MSEHPTNANSGRSELFRTSMSTPATITTLVVAPAAALILGAAFGGAAIALAAPVVAAALVVAGVFFIADRRASKQFWDSVALRLGYEFTFESELPPGLTPLLGAGQRRSYDHMMAGKLGATGLDVRLAHYRFEVRKESSDRDQTWTSTEDANRHQTWTNMEDSDGDGSWTSYPFTVCVVDMERGMDLFRGVYLRAKRGILGLGKHDWLAHRRLREVELESTAFNEAYSLQVANDQDDGRLRELFDPKTVVWFAEHPLKPHVEFRGGTLVVYVPDYLEDMGNLVYLLEAAEQVASRVQREVAEADATSVV